MSGVGLDSGHRAVHPGAAHGVGAIEIGHQCMITHARGITHRDAGTRSLYRLPCPLLRFAHRGPVCPPEGAPGMTARQFGHYELEESASNDFDVITVASVCACLSRWIA